MMEARTKGSGWEITSTLNAQEKKKKKKKKNDEELKIACAEKEEEEEEEEEEVIFKNALQSFSLISALRYPPTRDGVHQRTGESAKGAVSRSSKKPKRSGNEENELDGAALTEIRSNSSRKKRKQQEERKTKSLPSERCAREERDGGRFMRRTTTKRHFVSSSSSSSSSFSFGCCLLSSERLVGAREIIKNDDFYDFHSLRHCSILRAYEEKKNTIRDAEGFLYRLSLSCGVHGVVFHPASSLSSSRVDDHFFFLLFFLFFFLQVHL